VEKFPSERQALVGRPVTRRRTAAQQAGAFNLAPFCRPRFRGKPWLKINHKVV